MTTIDYQLLNLRVKIQTCPSGTLAPAWGFQTSGSDPEEDVE